LPTDARLVTAGHVGKPHGLDGSFVVNLAAHPLPVGTRVTVRGRSARVTRRAGTDARPIVRLEGIDSREAAGPLRGETLFMSQEDWPLEDGEWLAEDLVGCEIEGMGRVSRVIGGPSCEVLELADGTLVPLVRDAVLSVDTDARRIDVNRGFLGLDAA
jgi:16S rRNA processing protein RimM